MTAFETQVRALLEKRAKDDARARRALNDIDSEQVAALMRGGLRPDEAVELLAGARVQTR